MHCPKCQSDTEVIDSRQRDDGPYYRRRKCASCGHRFSTLEVLAVVKKKETYPHAKYLAPATPKEP
jgi:transcriptional regulator NrdR family protein